MRHVEFDGEDADEVLVPDGGETLDFSFDLFDFLSACVGRVKVRQKKGVYRHTLGRGVIVRVKCDDKELEWERRVHVVAHWFSEVHRSQALCAYNLIKTILER